MREEDIIVPLASYVEPEHDRPCSVIGCPNGRSPQSQAYCDAHSDLMPTGQWVTSQWVKQQRGER